jgi:5'-3' exonuclease
MAIPPQTYKYVLEKNIIDLVKSNKNIGFMIPEEFTIDVNKEHIFWKCQVKIPIVEYNEFISEIKKINITNEKNKIYDPVQNF